MSRALRKLRGDFQVSDAPVLTHSESEEEVYGDAMKNNPFELLHSLNGEKEEDHDDGPVPTSENPSTLKASRPMPISTGARKKTRKKAKKGISSAPNSGASEMGENEIDETVESLQAFMLHNQQMGAESVLQSSSPVAQKPLLYIDLRKLDSEAEMQKLLREKSSSLRIRKEKGDRRRVSRNQHHNHPKTVLVTAKPGWPFIRKSGVSMVLLSKEGNVSNFKYEHSKMYQEIQFAFLDAVESLNPDQIKDLVAEHPYHLDALLQLSEMFHFAENYGTAVDLIERALFFCESAFHPLFRIASGTCRLSYRYPENRALFIALFKQSEYVAGRGCPRTGLEYAKILLSLDPDEDPLAVLLYIDTLAIQSKEFEYLLEMNGLWETSRNLSQLPNFAFSVPLAQYHLNRDEADTALQEAILRFPAFVSLLMDKCGIQSDRVTSQHPHFSQQHSDGLMKLIKLYVARSYKIWKLPEVLRWLEENMSVVIGRLKSLEIAGERDSEILNSTERASFKARLEEFAEHHRRRYQGMPRNILRHIALSGFPEVSAAGSEERGQTVMYYHDPFPPADTIYSYSRPGRQRPEMSFLSTLLHTLFPSSSLPDAAREEQRQEPNDAGAQGGPPGAEFTRSLHSLLDAVLVVLDNYRPGNNPRHVDDGEDGAGDAGDDDSDNGDAQWLMNTSDSNNGNVHESSDDPD